MKINLTDEERAFFAEKGRQGGKSRSKKKVKAGRKNIKKADEKNPKKNKNI